MYTRKGISDTVVYDEAGIEERYGVPASSYAVLAALRGDPSDNLAGVPGVGEKTAAKLVSSYGTLDGIFAHLDEQTPKLRQNLAENEDRVRRNAKVIPLVRDVALELGLDDLVLGRVGHGRGEAGLRRIGDAHPVAATGAARWATTRHRCPGRCSAAGRSPAFDVSAVQAADPRPPPAEAAAAMKAMGAVAVLSLAPVWTRRSGPVGARRPGLSAGPRPRRPAPRAKKQEDGG